MSESVHEKQIKELTERVKQLEELASCFDGTLVELGNQVREHLKDYGELKALLIKYLDNLEP